MKTPRQSAFDILYKIYKDSAYSNLALDSFLDASSYSGADRAFVCALVYGVCERTITLDYQLSLYLTQPLKKLKPQVLTVLRMGAYQILFMDKVPVSAAVNESVKLAKNNSAAFAAGLVNAVLRKVAAAGLKLPKDENSLSFRSVKYSCPEWMLKLWSDSYGKENADKIAEFSLGAPQTVIRVNTLKTDCDSLLASLSKKGIAASKSNTAENALILEKPGSLKNLDEYKNGLFHVQDTASQLCCKALGAKSGETVLDICSAPGGKTFTVAEMMDGGGNITACDIYPSRLSLIEDGAKRLGIKSIHTLLNDGSVYNKDLPLADKILCDAPCAGLGVIRRKPEIRFKTAAEVDKLPEIQYSILTISAKYLKPGGVLVYSTCSLNKKENEDVFYRFLGEHKDFEPIRVLPEVERAAEDGDTLTLMPHIHGSDGFFISAFRRRNTP